VTRSALLDWKANPLASLKEPPLLTKGASVEQAKMTISEFVDFRCGHCRMAATPIAAFVSSKNDVRLEFFVFPLDGACNEAISRSDGGSCRMAKAVLCAERSKQGWAMHDKIFENQQTLNRKHSVLEIDWELKEYSRQMGLDFEELKACMESPEVHEKILAQTRIGKSAKVKGTPTIYVNGRKLPKGQLIPVLEKVYRNILEENASH